MKTITPPIRAKLIELCSTAITLNADEMLNGKPRFCVDFNNHAVHVAAWTNGECIYDGKYISLRPNLVRTEEEILENIAAVIDDMNTLQKTWESFAQGGDHA